MKTKVDPYFVMCGNKLFKCWCVTYKRHFWSKKQYLCTADDRRIIYLYGSYELAKEDADKIKTM